MPTEATQINWLKAVLAEKLTLAQRRNRQDWYLEEGESAVWVFGRAVQLAREWGYQASGALWLARKEYVVRTELKALSLDYRLGDDDPFENRYFQIMRRTEALEMLMKPHGYYQYSYSGPVTYWWGKMNDTKNDVINHITLHTGGQSTPNTNWRVLKDFLGYEKHLNHAETLTKLFNLYLNLPRIGWSNVKQTID